MYVVRALKCQQVGGWKGKQIVRIFFPQKTINSIPPFIRGIFITIIYHEHGGSIFGSRRRANKGEATN